MKDDTYYIDYTIRALIDDLVSYAEHRDNCASKVDGKKLSCTCGLGSLLSKWYLL